VIQVLRIGLPKDNLRAMPKEERALLFLLGDAANQITVFSKLAFFSTNKTPNNPIEQQIARAQSQMLTRFMIGILFETWKLISRRFLGSPIGREFEPKLGPEGHRALSELKEHFGRPNLLSTLRNNLAFHPPKTSDMDAGFEAAANDGDWDNDWNVYFSPQPLNTYYFVSDVVLQHAMLGKSDETNLIDMLNRIGNEVDKVSKYMLNFVYALSNSIVVKHFGPAMSPRSVDEIEGAPGIRNLWLPFYVEIPPEDPP
jgi:hypothetical protein